MANSLCIAEDRLKTNKTQDLGTVAHDEWHRKWPQSTVHHSYCQGKKKNQGFCLESETRIFD